MSDFGEALGTAVEGGLFARATAGRGGTLSEGTALDHGHFAEGACLNCGTQLVGEHCHACGQKAHLHRTLGAFGHDLMHGALHLDGKTWTTLPKLVFKPGELTRRYIDGERARFVSPMALFLFSVFLMFAIFQAVGITAPTDIGTGPGMMTEMEKVYADAQQQVADQRKVVADLQPTDEKYQKARARLDKYEADLESLGKARSLVIDTSVGKNSEGFGNTGIAFLDHAIEKWQKNPGLMLYKLQSNSYKFSWLLIPLSVPFMWLLFAWKRGFRAYDHAIFVTYSLAFMSLLFIVVSVLQKFGVSEDIWGTLLVVVPPLHIYKQLRGTYGLSRFSAIWRLCVLLVFIAIVLSLFLQLLLVLGAF